LADQQARTQFVWETLGKLHAKAAVIDKQALLSSANLTDDAFLRNLELGVLFMGGDMPTKCDNILSTSSPWARFCGGILEILHVLIATSAKTLNILASVPLPT
jgi:phosphatidylserine/phosphatidylglycerophosphate/cardiolipin synthase-like enzyme